MSALAPGFLIAAPPLGDSNFDRSVVLLANHGPEGAFGWIINGRELMTLSELLERADMEVPASPLTASVRLGGPVSPEQVWLLYREEERLPDLEGQFQVGPGVIASASRRVLEVIAEGSVPDSLLGFAGYAGWSAGQLEKEIGAGAWLPIDLDLGLIFDTPTSELWQRAYGRVGATPMSFTSRVGLA
jgi:putative transcriptional regulator